MRRSLPIVFVLFAAFGFVQPAEALLITPSTTPKWTTDIQKNLNNDEDWYDAFGYQLALPDELPDLLYKSEVGGSDSGPYANAYNTSYSNTPSDPSDALIKYLGGFYMDCSVCYLLIKDGNQSPAQYLFDISGWSGNEDISITGFWPSNGAISNVQILGTATRVPEPATAALLGSGIAALYLRRRKATA
jgi:hypothetical protein